MRDDRDRGQNLVRFRIGGEEVGGSEKAVDEHGLAAAAVGVGEAVEHLQAAGVGEVGGVGVAGERERGVGCVGGVGDRGEIPEGAVVRGADEGDGIEECFGRFGGYGSVRGETEAVGVDCFDVGVEAGGGGCDGVDAYGGICAWVGGWVEIFDWA